MKSQKNACLIYTAAEAWKLKQTCSEQFSALSDVLQFNRLLLPAQVNICSGCLAEYENLGNDKNCYKRAGLIEMINKQ